uniref:Uncharacterized protein n=1 Tax=Arion vulgaris TaxID=1028688 RepID=A0A0B6ZEB6_9EUPU
MPTKNLNDAFYIINVTPKDSINPMDLIVEGEKKRSAVYYQTCLENVIVEG